MTSDLPATPSESESPRTSLRVAAFVGLTLALLALLAFLAAHASPRVKLLALYPAGLGAAAGILVVRLAERFSVSRRASLTAAIVLVPLTMAGFAGESYRSWRSFQSESFASYLHEELPGGRAILERLRSGEQPANDVEAEFLTAYRVRLEPPVSAYLTARLKGLPVAVTMPWAAAVAAVELLLGCLAGIVAAILASRRTPPVSQEGRP